MKKGYIFAIIAVILAVFVINICAGSCTADNGYGYNKQIVDLTNHFEYAIVQRYDGEQIIHIDRWRDYEDGEQLQIVEKDTGRVYLLSSYNTILVSSAEEEWWGN